MTDQGYGSTARAMWGGIVTAVIGPALITIASWISFGTLARQLDMPLWTVPALTATIWALPGQLLFVDLYGTGASLAALWLTVALSSARFLPMTTAVFPLLGPRRPLILTLLAAQMTAVVAWSIGMRRCATLPLNERLPFYLGVAGTVYTIGILSAVAGFLMSGPLPPIANRALLIATFIYLAIMFGDQRQRPLIFAVCLGALGGPALTTVVPEWSLLIAGVVFGSAAFAIDLGIKKNAGKKITGSTP